MKGHYPKAYLRMDPNIDMHPDFAGMVLLICAANRQPHRGRFDVSIVMRLLGRKRADAFLRVRPGKKTPDLVELSDGRIYLDGWDEWQEGDLTVGERVRRLRMKRNGGVTSDVSAPLLARNPPSEASGVRRLTTTPPIPPANGGGRSVTAARRDEVRKAREDAEHRVEMARQYVIDNGGRVPRDAERQFKRWARAGHTLAEMQAAIDRGDHLPRRRL